MFHTLFNTSLDLFDFNVLAAIEQDYVSDLQTKVCPVLVLLSH
jgi:hypothetical protein